MSRVDRLPSWRSPAGIGMQPSRSNAPHLTIARNKHWKYISAYHGSWLELPVEDLESIANINYNTIRPRPIDPSTLFDVSRIRRLVDEATNLAVRAASDIASPVLTNVNGGSGRSTRGRGPVHGGSLSSGRRLRMREQAVKKLADAYRWDEVATSVVIMQGSSSLDDIASLVLQRSPNNHDAKYVHFFHEKIPSRQVADYTPLEPLRDIMTLQHADPGMLRTLGNARFLRGELDAAIDDFTKSLAESRSRAPTSRPGNGDGSHCQEQPRSRRRAQDVILDEQDHPSSNQSQALFLRATTYLEMASDCAAQAFEYTSTETDSKEPASETPASKELQGQEEVIKDSPKSSEEDPAMTLEEVRKAVKTFAKRAIRDYMDWLSLIDYSPHLPERFSNEYNKRANSAANGNRSSRASESIVTAELPKAIYQVSDLFAPVAPVDIPLWPTKDLKLDMRFRDWRREVVTYHPLLADGMHGLLLAHALAQTSPTELQRHAYMASRIIRLLGGYPVFRPCRSTARTDWMDVLLLTGNFLCLRYSWEDLCKPATYAQLTVEEQTALASLPPNLSPSNSESNNDASAVSALLAIGSSDMNAAQKRQEDKLREVVAEDVRKEKEKIRKQAIMGALHDERVTDDASFKSALHAREKRAEDEYQANLAATASSPGGADEKAKNGTSGETQELQSWKRPKSIPTEEECCSFRSKNVATWIIEGPQVASPVRRKRKPKKNGKLAEATSGIAKLDLGKTTEA